jgi:hypothetical protein
MQSEVEAVGVTHDHGVVRVGRGGGRVEPEVVVA